MADPAADGVDQESSVTASATTSFAGSKVTRAAAGEQRVEPCA